MLITVKFLGATSYRGARFIVSNGCNKKTFPYDYGAQYASESALYDFCEHFSIKKHWLDGGQINSTHFYISTDSPNALA